MLAWKTPSKMLRSICLLKGLTRKLTLPRHCLCFFNDIVCETFFGRNSTLSELSDVKSKKVLFGEVALIQGYIQLFWKFLMAAGQKCHRNEENYLKTLMFSFWGDIFFPYLEHCAKQRTNYNSQIPTLLF